MLCFTNICKMTTKCILQFFYLPPAVLGTLKLHLKGVHALFEHRSFSLALITMQKLAMTKQGPNDVKHIIWALGEFFILISVCFYILTNIFVIL